MATTYDKIAVLNDVCRKLEEAHLGELLGPLRAKMAELALQPSVPVPAVLQPAAQVAAIIPAPQEPAPEPAQTDDDTNSNSERRQKRSANDLLTLHKMHMLRNDEPCYIRSNNYTERYLIRFDNNSVRFVCPRDGQTLNSPLGVSKHHSSQIYPGHPEPTKPGNGWKHIKLSERDDASIGAYCNTYLM